MNTIYRSIWNAVTGSWTAVSEAQKSKGKKSKAVVASVLLTTLSLGATPVFAEDWWFHTDSSPLVIGKNDTAGNLSNKSSTYLSIQFKLADYTTTNFGSFKDNDGTGLLSHSSGLVQTLLNIEHYRNYGNAETADTEFYGSDTHAIIQDVSQGGESVATSYYAVGAGAYDILVKNQNELDISVLTGKDDQDIKLGDSWGSDNWQFSTTGMHIEGGSLPPLVWDQPDPGSISTVAILTGLSIKDNATLTITAEGEKNWYTKVHGGNTSTIKYVGNGADSSTLNFKGLNNVSEIFTKGDTNYTGETYFENITANLEVADSLGKTSLLNAVGSTLNVFNDSTVGKLNLVSSDLNLKDISKTFNVDADAFFDAGSQLIGSGTLNAKNVTLSGASNEFTGTVKSTETTTISHINALGSGQLQTDKLVFDAVTGTDAFDNAVNRDIASATNILLKNGSTVTYADNAAINTTSTTIEQGSSLKVVTNTQLGSSVSFTKGANATDLAKLTIQSTDANPLSGIQLSSNGDNGAGKYAVIELDGYREEGRTVYVLDDNAGENSHNTGYEGWIRIKNADLTLQTSHSHHGFSIGEGGNVFIKGNETVNLTMFGWSNESQGGVLDLTEFEFSDNKPALVVTDLYLDAPATIKVSADKLDFLSKDNIPQDTSSNLLGWDDEGSDYKVIAFTNKITYTSNYEITIEDGDDHVSKNITDNQNNVIASAEFGPNAYANDNGVWVNFGLSHLELLDNEHQYGAVALVLEDNVDNELSAQITGSGQLAVSKADGSSVGELKLTNEKNAFTNTKVTLNDGVTLSADIGALGQTDSNNTLVLNNATYKTVKVGSDDALEVQELGSVQGNGTIELADLTGLTLTGGYKSVELILKGAQNTALQIKEGAKLALSSAKNALNDFAGALTVDGTLSLTDTAAFSFTDTIKGALTGSGTIALNNANWTLPEVDFEGTYDLTNSALTVDAKTRDFNAKQVTLDKDSTLNVSDQEQFLGESKIAFTGTGNGQSATVNVSNTSGEVHLADESTDNGQFVLTNSNLSLARDTLLATDIDGTSVFTYKISDNTTSDWSLASITGQGTLGLSFAQHLDSLNLGDYSNFDGTVRFDNATLTIGGNTNYGEEGLTGQDGVALYVGTGSKLVVDGQATFSKDLTFEGGSTVDFKTALSDTKAMSFKDKSGVTINGEGGVKLNVSGADNITISDDFGSNAQDSLLDFLGSTVDNPADAASLMQSITLKEGQTAESLMGAMSLTGTDNTDSKTFAYNQNKDHVADIIAGVGLVASTNTDGTVNIGLGAVVTELQIKDAKTLVVDVSDRKVVSDSAQIRSMITGNGDIVFSTTGKLQGTQPDVLLNSAASTYTGTTTVRDGVWIQANNSGALGKTSMLTIGADDDDTARVTLHASNGAFTQTVGGIDVARSATLDLNGGENQMKLTIEGLGNGLSWLRGKLIGSKYSSLAINEDALLQMDQDTNLSAFEGSFHNDGMIIYEVAQGREATFAHEVEGDGVFTKTGAGTLTLSSEKVDYLIVTDGTVELVQDLSLSTLVSGSAISTLDLLSTESAPAAVIDLNGVHEIANFEGNGATIVMDVALGESAGNGATVELGENGNDGLHITNSASGRSTIQIRDKNALNKGAEERIKLVAIDANADVEFTLAAGAVTAGGYDYLLVQKDRVATAKSVETGSDWYLSSVEGEESVRNTTVNAGSYIAISSAAQLFDLSLHDRVGNRDWINPVTGEKQTTSLWLHQTFGHERSHDSTDQIRMRNHSSVTMLGGDLAQWTTSDNGVAYAGVMGGYGSMDTKSRSKRTNLTSEADTDAWGVGAYFGWKANEAAFSGPYVDGWLMFMHAESTVKGTDIREEVKGQGLSASIEAGWGVHVGSVKTDNGKTADFHIEPHASATWFGMSYDDISNNAHDVTFEGKNNVRTRVGARFVVSERETDNFNAFVEANWVHNTQEYGAVISGLDVDQAGSRNQGEARLGVNWRVTDGLSVWARGSASIGDDGYNKREGSVGVRYQF